MSASLAFEAIGTHWTIDIDDTGYDAECQKKLEDKILNRIEMYDRTYSRFRDDSLIREAGRTPGTYELPEDSNELFSLYRTFYDATNGYVTPLIGDVLDAAGYDATYTLMEKRPLTTPHSWDESIAYAQGKLTTRMPVIIDIGAGGKGHLIDIVGNLIEEEGIGSYTVEAGGDIRYRTTGGEPLRVGLENPFDTESVVGVAHILNESICGSAGNRRAWGNFHHIINPVTLTSPRHLSGVWVVAESTFLADLLTTALFFVPPEEMLEKFSFTYALLDSEGVMTYAPNFPGEFFTR